MSNFSGRSAALEWVRVIKIGDQTAKHLILFYASHAFYEVGFEFTNKELSDKLEVSTRQIQNAHRLLKEKKLIKQIPQFAIDGSQKNNITYLNIPQEFVDNFIKNALPRKKD